MASTGDSGISDEAVLIYTWTVYGVLCQIINVFGIVTNIINVICFAKQGFADSVNISLLGLAVSDLGSLTTMLGTCFFLTPAVAAADWPFEQMTVMYLTTGITHFSFTRVSGCITAIITLERCLCIAMPLQIKNIITPRRTTVITVFVFFTFLSTSAPVYFVNRLERRFSALRNTTLVGLVTTEYCEQVETVTFIVNNFIIPFVSFAIIVVCTAILSLKLRRTAEWRKLTITSAQAETVTSRNQRAAKMVLMVSTLYIVCFVPVTFIMLAVAFLPDLKISGKNVMVGIMVAGLAYMMESLNSSMNIFIYYCMSKKYRDTVEKFFIVFYTKRTSADKGF